MGYDNGTVSVGDYKDSSPFMQGGSAFVPLRDALAAAGIEVQSAVGGVITTYNPAQGGPPPGMGG